MNLCNDSGSSNPIWEEYTLQRVDFNSIWGGDLVNIATCISPLGNEAETQNYVKSIIREIASWLIDHRNQFSPQDRFQIIVGWDLNVRSGSRDIVKEGGTWDELTDIAKGSEVTFRRGWNNRIF